MWSIFLRKCRIIDSECMADIMKSLLFCIKKFPPDTDLVMKTCSLLGHQNAAVFSQLIFGLLKIDPKYTIIEPSLEDPFCNEINKPVHQYK